MSITDEKFLGNVENLKTIAEKVDNNYFEIIKALSFFLSHTNKNYYYNETYLTDQFLNFESFLRKFHFKGQFSNTLYKYLQVKMNFNDKNLNAQITIDEIWKFTYKDNHWHTNMNNGSLKYISRNQIYVSFELFYQEEKIEMHEEFDINEENKELKICQQISKYYDEFAEYEENRYGKGNDNRKQVI